MLLSMLRLEMSVFVVVVGGGVCGAGGVGQPPPALNAANPRSHLRLCFSPLSFGTSPLFRRPSVQVYLPCILASKKRYVGHMYESPKDLRPSFDAKVLTGSCCCATAVGE